MSDEGNHARPDNRATTLGLVFLMSMLGAGAAVGMTYLYSDGTEMAPIFTLPLSGFVGFVVGACFGAFLALLLPKSVRQVNESVRTVSAGPQLVGQHCVLCHKEITSILEGEFCVQCRASVHHKCIPETIDAAGERCPRCGSFQAGK